MDDIDEEIEESITSIGEIEQGMVPFIYKCKCAICKRRRDCGVK